jgi:circadian clock protein KaiB
MSMASPEKEPPAAQLRVRLYVAGDSPNSITALANLRALLVELRMPADVMEIIDVLQDPARGLRDGVLVTPMLVRVLPAPERRILGNLSDRTIMLGLLSPIGVVHE